VQGPKYWRVPREDYNHLGEITYPSTTSDDQNNHIGLSIRLKAPIWPSKSQFPDFVSFDSIVLEPYGEDSRYGRPFRLLKTSRDPSRLLKTERYPFQLLKTSTYEAKKLHFVILGVYPVDPYCTIKFGLILAPSEASEGAFVRLGIWSDRGNLYMENWAAKFEYTII